jgi:hypothetical protein
MLPRAPCSAREPRTCNTASAAKWTAEGLIGSSRLWRFSRIARDAEYLAALITTFGSGNALAA